MTAPGSCKSAKLRRAVSTASSRAQAAPCPPPDFLSLDVQSGEYEVLLGARDALDHSICGLIVEVEFGEMYVGQRRFQDVYDLLDGAGFDFVRFLAIGETSVRAPLGFRGDGYQDFADALFLRRCDRVPRDDAGRGEMLTKLCFFALTFGVVELAVQCIAALHGATLPQARAYQRFVAACRDVYERDAKLLPPLFSAILPPHRVADYSAAAGSSNGLEYSRACAASMPPICASSSATIGGPTANSKRCCAGTVSPMSLRR